VRIESSGWRALQVALMAYSVLKVLLLARQVQGDDETWPLTPLLDRLEQRGILPQVLCVSAAAIPSNDPRAIEVPALANRWLRPFRLRRLWSDSRVSRPHVLHALDDSLSSIALALCETAGIPYVQSVNSFSTLKSGLRVSRRWCCRIVAASNELAGDLVTELRIPARLITVIPPGVVETDSAPRENPAIKSVPVIGTTGTSEDFAGFMILLEAAKLVIDAGHEVEFVIATREAEHVDLRHRATKLGVTERMTALQLPIVGPRFWSLLDVYCQPSVGPSAGRTLLYALAHGVPSIGTDVKGIRSLLANGENGLLVPPGDPEATQEAILRLLQDPDESRRLGLRARESIRACFNPEVEADMLATLYRQVVAER
jgi:glycosyltransferase involved in cell wall biosynthesis